MSVFDIINTPEYAEHIEAHRKYVEWMSDNLPMVDICEIDRQFVEMLKVLARRYGSMEINWGQAE